MQRRVTLLLCLLFCLGASDLGRQFAQFALTRQDRVVTAIGIVPAGHRAAGANNLAVQGHDSGAQGIAVVIKGTARCGQILANPGAVEQLLHGISRPLIVGDQINRIAQ